MDAYIYISINQSILRRKKKTPHIARYLGIFLLHSGGFRKRIYGFGREGEREREMGIKILLFWCIITYRCLPTFQKIHILIFVSLLLSGYLGCFSCFGVCRCACDVYITTCFLCFERGIIRIRYCIRNGVVWGVLWIPTGTAKVGNVFTHIEIDNRWGLVVGFCGIICWIRGIWSCWKRMIRVPLDNFETVMRSLWFSLEGMRFFRYGTCRYVMDVYSIRPLHHRNLHPPLHQSYIP